MQLTRDDVTVYAADLAAYVAALYPPGCGPRTETDPGLEAWEDLLMILGLPPDEFKRAALAFSLSHPGRWDAGAFAKSRRAVEGGDVGEMWAIACRWVSALKAGPVYRGGQKLEPPTMADMLARPDRQAMARAVQALGVDAIRERTTDQEGTMRAQFRKFFEEAQATQTARAVSGLTVHVDSEKLRAAPVLALPDLRADRDHFALD